MISAVNASLRIGFPDGFLTSSILIISILSTGPHRHYSQGHVPIGNTFSQSKLRWLYLFLLERRNSDAAVLCSLSGGVFVVGYWDHKSKLPLALQ